MWDHEQRYPNVTPAYCRDACGPIACKECPRPRPLSDALPGLLAYLSISTQWRYGPSGHPTGLAYGDCLPMLERQCARLAEELDREIDMPELMDDVQEIERAILGASAELARAEGSTRG